MGKCLHLSTATASGPGSGGKPTNPQGCPHPCGVGRWVFHGGRLSERWLFLMQTTPRKVSVPAFQLTQLCDADEVGATPRRVRHGEKELIYHYHQTPCFLDKPRSWNSFSFPLDRCGRLWDLATVYLLDRIQIEALPSMATYSAAADDLSAFRFWLDDQPKDLLFHFPQNKLERVTYRYFGYLKLQFFDGRISAETANHRMLTVIDFYRFLSGCQYFSPDFPAWAEKQVRLSFKTDYGAVINKSVTTTDLKIKAPKASDAFRDTILDGGQLRPLTQLEQGWLMDALKSFDNPEMYLLCLFMLTTGARVQTACTLRVGHFLENRQVFRSDTSGGQEVVKIKCGPGTLIDTKNDKQGLLQVPLIVFEALRTFAHSSRAQRRRAGAKGGDCPEQYLFLTNRCKPYYLDKAEARTFDPSRTTRHASDGGTIRKFLSGQVVPYIHRHHDPKFAMKIHDMRASFGMNQTDIQLALVESGKTTLSKARDIVRQLMWHESASTTDRYLDYRSRQALVYAAINTYGEQVQGWINYAMNVGRGSDV